MMAQEVTEGRLSQSLGLTSTHSSSKREREEDDGVEGIHHILSRKRDSMAKVDASMPACALLSTNRQIKGCAECEEKEKNLLEIFAHLQVEN